MRKLQRRSALLALMLSPALAPLQARAAAAFPPASALDLPTFTLSGSDEVRKSFYGRWLLQIYTEAFRRLGYRFVYATYPLRRSVQVSNTGMSDGEIHRVQSYGEHFPMMVKVEEPHFSSRFVAYAVRPGLRVNGLLSLRGSGLAAGILAGTLRLEQQLPTVLPSSAISIVPGIDQGMRMLNVGRFDIFINGEALIDDWLRSVKDPRIDLSRFYRAGVIEPIDFHAFLAPQHAKLAPKLAATLRQMKQEGLIERYRIRAHKGLE